MAYEFAILFGVLVWSYLGLRLLKGADDVVVSWPKILLAGPAIWLLALIVVLSSIRIKRRG